MNANELANIWRKPIYLPYLQDPLTPEALRTAEEELGRALPRELVMMLSIQNGGYLRYELEGYPLDAVSGIGEAHPSLTRFSWGEERECVSFELDGLVPFSGDGHWYLCLDYRASEQPAVAYIDVECDEQSIIAQDFASFLALLRLDTGGKIALHTGLDLDGTKARLEEILGVRARAADPQLYGFSVYNFAREGGMLSLSPNEVRLGFARRGERRFKELKNFSEPALRYAELDAGAMILDVFKEELMSEILRELKSAGLCAQSLKDAIGE